MGGGDKPLRLIAGRPLLDLCHRAGAAAGLGAGAQRQWRSGALRALTACRSSPTASPIIAGPLAGVLAGLDWAAEHRPDCPLVAQRRRPTRRSCRPTSSPGWKRMAAERRRSCLRRLGRTGASGDRAVAGAAAPGSAPRHGRGGHPQGRCVDRALPARRRRRFPIGRFDPFFNANRPDDLDAAASLLASGALR